MTVLSAALTKMSVFQTPYTFDFPHLRGDDAGTLRGMVVANTTTIKELPVRLLLIFVLIIASILIGSSPSHAQDVYNFYFQKNMGATPNIVTPQGPASSPSAVAATPVAPVANQVSAEVATTPLEKAAFKKWDIGIAKTWMATPTETKDLFYDDKYTYKDAPTKDAYNLSGSYRFNRFVAAEAGIVYSTKWQVDRSEMGEARSVDGNIGIALTPIHINLFGYELIEIGILGGAMTQTSYKMQKTFNDTKDETKKIDEKKSIVPYVGPRLAINLTQDLAIVMDARLKPQSDGGGFVSTGLKYRF